MLNLSPSVGSAAPVTPEVEANQYLTFMLDNQLFAVGILSIKEIIQFGQITTVPLMPNYIRGVINLRGSVVPVIDLSVRFERAPSIVGKRTSIIIIEIEHQEETYDIGIMVDAVSEVIDIATSQIEPAPSFGTNVRADFIAGIGKVNQRFVVLLDIDHTFSLDELATIASANLN